MAETQRCYRVIWKQHFSASSTGSLLQGCTQLFIEGDLITSSGCHGELVIFRTFCHVTFWRATVPLKMHIFQCVLLVLIIHEPPDPHPDGEYLQERSSPFSVSCWEPEHERWLIQVKSRKIWTRFWEQLDVAEKLGHVCQQLAGLHNRQQRLLDHTARCHLMVGAMKSPSGFRD